MATAQVTSKKLALIIGNNNYKKGEVLKFCINDAQDLSEKLKTIGFETTVAVDATFDKMGDAIDEFTNDISDGDLALFFFAGHGTQLDGENYLIPIDDDKIQQSQQLKRKNIKAQDILKDIVRKKPKAVLFFLDCCHNYRIQERSGATCNSAGLAPMGAPRGSLVAFACDPDRTASDQSLNGRNGLFTSHLLKYICEPNMNINQIMTLVCDGVRRDSDDEQWPHTSNSLPIDVTLNEAALKQIDIPNININSTWIQDGITVAGGHGEGNELNQLSRSYGVFIYDDEIIYVADTNNHRIVEWRKNAINGRIVAGGNGQGNRNDQLFAPMNVIIDKESGYLIVSDHNNKRVVRWPRQNGQNGETIISNVVCFGLTMDNDGYLYVSDVKKHEVRRWKMGDMNGTLVAGGNGKGDLLNQLDGPYYIFVDQDHSVYVSDRNNHRVMKWMKDAIEGIVVAGGQGEGNSLRQLSIPYGIIVDQLGSVYVADYNNNRVMRWLEGAEEGTIVVGGNGKAQQPNQFNGSIDLSFDRENNLYVLDRHNHRVQKFDINLN